MNDSESISGLQLFSIALCFLFGTVLRSSLLPMAMANDSWMAAFMGAIAYLPQLAILLALARRYPGKSLFQINEAVFGPVAGRALSCVYLYFFITLLAVATFDMGNFVVEFTMRGTPLVVVVSVFSLACCYGARKGAGPLARVSTLLVIGAFLILIVNTLLTLPAAQPRYLLPMFTLPLSRYVQGAHVAASVYYGESIVLFSLLPLMAPGSCPRKPLIAAALLSIPVIFLVQIREVLTLGPLLPFAVQPSYETLRMVDLETVVTRIESIYAFLMVSLTLFKACTILYASASGIAQVTRAESPRPMVFLLGGLAAVYGVKAYGSTLDSLYWTLNVSPFLLTAVEAALPLLTLMTSWGKGIAQGGQANKAVSD